MLGYPESVALVGAEVAWLAGRELDNGYATAPFRCFLADGRGSINARIASR
jgi:hypothetical protein